MDQTKKQTFPLDYRFFGLTLSNSGEFRKNLFTQIHNIVYHGNGGYDFGTVYNMPIWLRKFVFKEIDDYNKKLTKQMNDSRKGKGTTNILDQKTGKINPPKFNKQNPKQAFKRSSYK